MSTDHPCKTNTIFIRKFLYNGYWRIAISFNSNSVLNKKVREIGAIWTRTYKCWHVSYDKESYYAITKAFRDCDIQIKKDEQKQLQPVSAGKGDLKDDRAAQTVKVLNVPAWSPNNDLELQRFVEMLTLKGYSPSTQRTYRNEFGTFLRQLKNVNVQEMTPVRLSAYLFYCHRSLKLSENTIHSRLNALKFYYENVLKQEKFLWEIPRPKKQIILPKVISEEKIIYGLTAIKNLKHRALLIITYSAGLRVSEVINLKLTDINSDRMQIFIERAKGKKDRMVTLSSFALKILREYYTIYKPKYWLFEGQVKGGRYSTRSAQEIFKAAYRKMKLPPKMSFHSLRHSFATHLLENGTDIKYIQEILGHNDINTTLRYTHVSKKAIERIESPLDKIARKFSI